MKEDLKRSGYSVEEEYFYKLNKELIEKRRKELDAGRTRQESNGKNQEYWMRCPKCGAELVEVDMVGIKVDQCMDCRGLYFDYGELDLLLAAREPNSFFDRLKKAITQR